MAEVMCKGRGQVRAVQTRTVRTRDTGINRRVFIGLVVVRLTVSGGQWKKARDEPSAQRAFLHFGSDQQGRNMFAQPDAQPGKIDCLPKAHVHGKDTLCRPLSKEKRLGVRG